MRKAAETLALLLALSQGSAVVAQEAAPDCASLTAALRAVPGYELTAPPAGPQSGWCVLDGATLRSLTPGWPNLHAERLRLQGGPGRMSLDLAGLRVTPKLGDTTINERLRSLFRLQTADLQLTVVEDVGARQLRLEGVVLRLSGGTELSLEADIKGAGLAPTSLAGGALTRLALEWRNDGRLLRPLMELAGEEITRGKGASGAVGGAAVDAVRKVLTELVEALPEAALAEGTRAELRQAVAALPQGRGRLVLHVASKEGIGAARVALAVMSGNPLGEASLARLLQGAMIDADWQPGITP